MAQKNVYFINLTREYQQALSPKPETVAAWFHQQSPVVAYMIPQRQKGIFKIQCKSNDDFKKLKKFKNAKANREDQFVWSCQENTNPEEENFMIELSSVSLVHVKMA